jgi:hypothetical protein
MLQEIFQALNSQNNMRSNGYPIENIKRMNKVKYGML